jgi:biopolymer transport protein ExbB
MENLLHLGPLYALAAFATIITLDRFYVLYLKTGMGNADPFFNQIKDLVLKNKIQDALNIAHISAKTPYGFITIKALERAGQPEENVKQALELAYMEISETYTKRTNYLSMIANVSTLVGLFGTVLGLVQSFRALGNAAASQKSALLAAGISTAMNATLIGLGIAIPSMVLYSVFATKGNKVNSEIEKSCVKLMDLLSQRMLSITSQGFNK